ncbi:MAG: DUF5105 domain-containing protein [Oscillospiraceae bacterium]|nr:DUF5105 domain-containing protein [Oscillospiraceae bacterium]
MKRKILAIFLAVALVLSAASCSSKQKTSADKPQDVLASFIAALNQGDLKKAGSYTNDTKAFDIGDLEAYASAEPDSEEAFNRDLTFLLFKKLKLKGTSAYTESGDKSSLTAQIATADIKTIIEEAQIKLADAVKADPARFSDEANVNKYMFDELKKALEAEDAKSKETELKVTFVKVSGEWKIDITNGANNELGSLLIGGATE